VPLQAERKLKYEPLVPGFLHVSPPYHYRFGDGQSEEVYNAACLRELEQTILYEGAESVAAVIVECDSFRVNLLDTGQEKRPLAGFH